MSKRAGRIRSLAARERSSALHLEVVCVSAGTTCKATRVRAFVTLSGYRTRYIGDSLCPLSDALTVSRTFAACARVRLNRSTNSFWLSGLPAAIAARPARLNRIAYRRSRTLEENQ